MKFLILLLLPALCSAQHPSRLSRIVIGGSGGSTTLPVDTSQELRVFRPVMDVTFDATRPNKRVVVTDALFFNMNGIIPGYSGQVTFVNGGSWPVSVNGNGTVGTSTVTVSYSNSGGVITWH